MSLDFVRVIKTTQTHRDKSVTVSIAADFNNTNRQDLMTRGGRFYAVWDEDESTWSTDLARAYALMDAMLSETADEYISKGIDTEIKFVRSASSRMMAVFRQFCQDTPDWYIPLDSHVHFLNDKITREMYATKRLPYPRPSQKKKYDCPAYDELIGTLYDDEERRKFEWGIGSILADKAKDIQKMYIFYGDPGSGKSTVLDIIWQLFIGYSANVAVDDLGKQSAAFAATAFSDNPVVGIQHEADLSHIETNVMLNTIISHEPIEINQKYQIPYYMRLNTVLFVASNEPVMITDMRSGLLRRLIEISPSGKRVEPDRYFRLRERIQFELEAIANRCLRVFNKCGQYYYDDYRPQTMLEETNDTYNFVQDSIDYFLEHADEGIPSGVLWRLYNEWVTQSNVRYPLSRRWFNRSIKPFFDSVENVDAHHEGVHTRHVYQGFRSHLFKSVPMVKRPASSESISPDEASEAEIQLGEYQSPFDAICGECPAQYTKEDGTPTKAWDYVKTTLSNLDTHKLHYVRVPENLIVIDFDLKDVDGNKCLAANLDAASAFPSTYAEVSQSGGGLHLHYFYTGDLEALSTTYSPDIEIKVYRGKSALRRKLSLCNQEEIATISSGLPTKTTGGGKVISFSTLKNERAIRTLIIRNLQKAYHPGTKPSVEFIKKVLDDAYSQGIEYDVTDLKPAVIEFAGGSTHHADRCLDMVGQMHFQSDHEPELPYELEAGDPSILHGGTRKAAFYDVEIFPNLFVICYKVMGDDKVQSLVNPSSDEVESFVSTWDLIGFNNRKYDNHILYARMAGYSTQDLYELSRKLISSDDKKRGSTKKFNGFLEAYNLAFADIYDFSSKKQSLKKFEIELGIHHQELGLDWNQPVPEDLWGRVVKYCEYDVEATEATFYARSADWKAREILSDLSGLPVNRNTRAHITQYLFEGNRHPQSQFVYTDLSQEFPGYNFDPYGKEDQKSTYRGEFVKEGGYVYAEPGIYENVECWDVTSMHPHSLKYLNLFGDYYTNRWWDIVEARVAIKQGNLDKARSLMDGKLAPYLENASKEDLDDLAYALKIIINSTYGYTFASFPCEFKDDRNIDNIVAKRGALFMVDLKHEVQDRGYQVVHIKTDSIKIANPDDEIRKFIQEYGESRGYPFELEHDFEKFCLVNDAVYIAKERGKGWTATGTQFQVPYVFKTLFSNESVAVPEDLCEVKSVSGSAAIYLDMNEGLGEDEHDYQFVGRVGEFCPIAPGEGGGEMKALRNEKYSYVTGTKGYRWLESERVRKEKIAGSIDMTYFQRLADKAIKTIEKFGSFEEFVGR